MKNKKRMLLITLLLVLFSSIIFTGCGSKISDQNQVSGVQSKDSMALKISPSVAFTESSGSRYGLTNTKYNADTTVSDQTVTNQMTPEIRKQMMIYNGSFHIIVKDMKDASSQITQKVRESQGYLVNSNSSENSQHYYAHYEYRIPVNGFHSLIDEINNMELGTITNQGVTGQDITKEYYDLDARLNAKKIYEKRLLDFLEKANKTEDLLKISNDLNRVEEDIDRMQGQLDYYKYHADFSTLIIDLEQSKDNVVPNATAWEKSTNGFQKSIDDIVQFFTAIFVWIISYSPILILFIILLFIVLKMKGLNYFKNKQSKKLSPQTEQDEDEDKKE